MIFLSVFPHMQSPEHLWYSVNVPWESFTSFVEAAFNAWQQQLLKTIYMLLDESMLAWQPKTTKFGRLPNLTLEPMKPLGTMFKNGVKATTGLLGSQDIMQGSEAQAEKKYYGDESQACQRRNQSWLMSLRCYSSVILQI